MPRWWTPQHRAHMTALGRAGCALCFFDTSGLEYIELARGRRSVTVVTWDLVWDHAAGLLLHAEAGGVAVGVDGAPYRLAGGNALPLILAPSQRSAAAVLEVLAAGEVGPTTLD
jgi:fructose-1,6-bisphosphatase/inositol monophosphatase family enzyme